MEQQPMPIPVAKSSPPRSDSARTSGPGLPRSAGFRPVKAGFDPDAGCVEDRVMSPSAHDRPLHRQPRAHCGYKLPRDLWVTRRCAVGTVTPETGGSCCHAQLQVGMNTIAANAAWSSTRTLRHGGACLRQPDRVDQSPQLSRATWRDSSLPHGIMRESRPWYKLRHTLEPQLH